MMIKKICGFFRREHRALLQFRTRIGEKPVSPAVMVTVICLGVFVAAMIRPSFTALCRYNEYNSPSNN
jgi:hypothetical protein